MKRKSLLAAASAVVLLAGSANAELIFGLSNFAPANPEVNYGGIFATSITNGVNDALVFSSDGTYGDVPGAPGGNSSLKQSLTNNPLQVVIQATGGSSPNPINALVFDANGFGPEGHVVNYRVEGPNGTISGTYTTPASGGAFLSIYVWLGAIAITDSITVTVDGNGTQAVIDNIGIIPEPSGALALAGLLGAGLLVRSRCGVSKAPALA